MPGKRIPQLDAIAGASTANDDNLVIYDTDAGTTKRILRSQLAAGLVGDLPYTPAGFISSTTVPTAIAEVASDLAAAGGAALIGNTPAGTIAASTVQGAINEIVSDLAASSGSSLVGFLQAGTSATARTAQAKLRDVVSVKDFGAVGDGVTDDTTFLQAAITAAEGKTLLLPKGTYIVSNTLTLPSNTDIVGEGWQSIIYLKSGTNKKVFTNSDTSGGNVNIWLDSFAVDGNSAGQTGGSFVTGIDLDYVTDFKINNVYVHHTREIPIYIRKGSNFEITGCKTEFAQGATYPGIYIGNPLLPFPTAVTNGTISNCWSNNNGQDGILVENATDVRVIGCSARNNGQSGIKLGQPANCIVSSCYAEGNTSGFRGQDIKRCTYNGNIAYRNNDSGITLGISNATASEILVTNNQCIENGQNPTSTSYGINVYYLTGGTVNGLYIKNNVCVDNQSVKTQTRGISLATTGTTFSNVSVDGNYCKGNSVSDYFSNLPITLFKDAGNIGFTGSSTIPFLYPTSTNQFQFWADNIPASSGTVYANDGASGRGFVMPRAGYLRSISVKANAACTAGSCTFQTRVNGVNISFNATINTTNSTYVINQSALRANNLTAGDYIQVAYVSDASFAPAGTTDYNIIVEVVY